MSADPRSDVRPDSSPDGTSGESLWRQIDRSDLVRIGVVAAAALAVGLGVTWPWPRLPAIALAGLVIGCWPVIREAWHDVRQRRMSMELSMLIAIVAAAAIGEWVTALVITAFVLAAEILEDLSMDRGRGALTDLMAFLPTTITVRREHGLEQVAHTDVVAGDRVLVAPGGKVPVDGTVVSGTSSVDESRITGEAAPRPVVPPDRVYAGSINQLGAIEISAERVGAHTSYGQIVEAVQRAQATPAPAQRLADRLAAYIVYFALAAAVVTFVVTRDLTATISVVVVAGACGIAAGTPLAVLAAMGRAARTGAFIKGGRHLEALSAVDTVVFDKTGTLTEGRPGIIAIDVAPGHGRDELLQLAASAELPTEHPLGQAIVARARDLGLELSEPAAFEYQPGLGVSASVDGVTVKAGTAALVTPPSGAEAEASTATCIHVSANTEYLGCIHLDDLIRGSAPSCIRDLHHMGIKTVMLTGDRPRVAETIAAGVGIEEVRAGLLPAQKQTIVEAERAKGRRVAMVGDGVNDAPALAVADVGIAMGSGTAIARESADVILISSDLADLTRTIAVARRARRIIMANFIGTIAVDLVGMVLAALGLLGPVLAALVHVASETVFILNSARLIPGRQPGRSQGGPPRRREGSADADSHRSRC